MLFLAPRNYYLLLITRHDSNTQFLPSSPYFVSVYIILSVWVYVRAGLGVGLGTYRHSNAFDYFTHVHVDIVYTLT